MKGVRKLRANEQALGDNKPRRFRRRGFEDELRAERLLLCLCVEAATGHSADSEKAAAQQ